ncbi:MAG: hypothetical protein MMC33_008809 [Icmadophila ericetorum]|nr:hypothetical protein [Icmadophila ericetorum]
MDHPRTLAQPSDLSRVALGMRAVDVASGGESKLAQLDQSSQLLPSARKSLPTPHTVRALKQKQSNAETPARERRKSGRLQRQTPRDGLRNLSRILAKTSKKYESSPEPSSQSNDVGEAFEIDMEENTPIPQLSMPIYGDEDTDEVLDAPVASFSVFSSTGSRSQYSGELIRRAHEEESEKRLSRAFDRSGVLNEITAHDSTTVHLDTHANDTSHQDYSLKGLFPNHKRSLWVLHRLRPEALTVRSNGPIFQRNLVENHAVTIHDADEIAPELGMQIDEDSLFPLGVPDRLGGGRESVIIESALNDKERLDQTHEGDRESRAVNTQLLRYRVHKKTKQTSRISKFPMGTMKKVANAFLLSSRKGKARIDKGALGAIAQVSDWFLKQVVDDLETFAEHAGRETIVESDAITLMRR